MDVVCAGAPPTLGEAMRYSLLSGGKRLRPILALAACEAVGGQPEEALDAACAIEMIHTYSLIHDDLPAMDDDDFRRGRKTSHKVFGEAVAILAGDALLTEAFRVAATARAGREARVAEVVFEVARAAGAAGMVGGQVIDIEATGRNVTVGGLEALHHAKTGELLLVSVRAGAWMGGAGPEDLQRLTVYGRALGLAFQIVDDVLDVTADLATLGKDPGSDRAAGKTTFVDLLGEGGAKARAREVMDAGIAALAPFGDRARPLEALARYTVERDR
ncbi:MAG: polyprenyl synthetase family protein [Myxococcales bacterium]|nr:polyprenyl synthetase family protein [Myxococcales bacterium]